ncbi:MAG: FAD-dependent oxidoreductase [Oscillospiraceae bacterium]
MKVVIVGGVAGGASAAARLRRLDEKAEIIMLERGSYISYANCGLPYYIGGEIEDKDELTLQTPESFTQRFAVDVRINSEAVLINKEEKYVEVKNTLTGEKYTETYDKLILSPGAEPVMPPLPGIEDKRIFTLRTIPDTFKIHEYIKNESNVRLKKAVVVGGGFIGLEMAENLTAAGFLVSVVEAADHVMATLDYDMASDVHHYLRKKGVSLYLQQAVTGFADGGGYIDTKLKDGTVLSTDLVLLSVGVRPESSLAKNAGILCTPKGAIEVNEHMLTSNSHIYAVGDAVSIKQYVTDAPAYIPLAGPANKQGRIAADNICGMDTVYKGTQGSAVAKIFDMTVASTGLSETVAGQAGLSFTKLYTYSPSHASYYPGANSMSIKTVFEVPGGRVLGAQLVGFDGVDKRCDVFATAIRVGMTVQDLTELELSYAPPFSSAKDPVNMAGYAAENILTGKVKQFFWQDVEAVLKNENAVLLDVRTEEEYQAGHIEGSVWIPLDTLRDRINELDAGKTIYVHCQSGLRSYVACRLLMQNGFDCFNLSGGYRLYASVTKELAPDKEPRHACGVKA